MIPSGARSISTPLSLQMGQPNIYKRAEGYGMPGEQFDGFDPLATFDAVSRAMERARNGGGPTLLEGVCYRFLAHSTDDNDMTYRTRDPGNLNDSPRVDAVYRALRNGVTASGPTQLYASSDASVAAFTTIAGAGPFRFFGDYAGISASSKSANPIWEQAQNFRGQQDNPTGTHQRSFSAALR